MKKLKLLLFALIVAPMIFISGCKDKGGLKKIKVAEVTHSVFYAPQYIAATQGFFEEEGLDVEIMLTSGADKIMAALLSGEVQIGLMGSEASIYVYNRGSKNYAINFAQLTQKDGSFLVGRENINNFDVSMLDGAEILGGRKGGMPLMVLEYILKSAGLEVGRDDPTKDVYVRTDVDFAVLSGQFIAGEGDYVSLFDPLASTVEKNGDGYVMASLGALSGEIPYTSYSALKKYIDKNEDVIQKFTNAIYRGQLWVYANDNETVANALKPFFTELTDEELVRVVKNYKDISSWALNPTLTKAALDKLMDIMELAGELDKRAPYEKVVTTKFAAKAIETVSLD